MRRHRILLALTLSLYAGIGAAESSGSEAGAFVPGAYYLKRMELFAAAPLAPGDVVFLGDSLTEGAHWVELLPGLPVRDRGIAGDTTAGVLARLATITAARPAAVFLMIGTNDLGASPDPAPSLARQREIIARIRRESPSTLVFVQSLLPRAAVFRERIEGYNLALYGICRELGATWVDLYPAFLAPDGALRRELTYDGVHLAPAGYRLWRSMLAPHLGALRAAQPAARRQSKAYSLAGPVVVLPLSAKPGRSRYISATASGEPK